MADTSTKSIDHLKRLGDNLVVVFSDGSEQDLGEIPSGRRGPQGEKGEQGLAGLTYQGIWSPDTRYEFGDVVAFGSALYVAQGQSVGVRPTVGLTAWKYFLGSGGEASLPAGEGFLERHHGTVQMTPLLRDGVSGEPIITRFVLDAPVVEM